MDSRTEMSAVAQQSKMVPFSCSVLLFHQERGITVVPSVVPLQGFFIKLALGCFVCSHDYVVPKYRNM